MDHQQAEPLKYPLATLLAPGDSALQPPDAGNDILPPSPKVAVISWVRNTSSDLARQLGLPQKERSLPGSSWEDRIEAEVLRFSTSSGAYTRKQNPQ